jgi:hypothetical protein
MEHACGALAEPVDVAEDRHAQATRFQEQLHFVELPHVVAQLRNDPLRAGAKLAQQLEVLRHQLALVEFERIDRAADEEVGLGERFDGAAASGDLQAVVHRAKQADEAQRIEVEHGLGQAAEAARGIIAGQRENTLEPLRGIAPGRGFEAVAVHVLAGEVHDHLAAPIGNQAGEPIGREHGATAGIVGERDPADPRIVGQGAHELREPGRRIGLLQAPSADHLRPVIEAVTGDHLAETDTLFGRSHVGLPRGRDAQVVFPASLRATATAELALSP